jgi:cytochrome c-type biogenesis protein CcmH/NrfG
MEVLTLMAMHYHRSGHYAEAADYWQRMLKVMPPDSEAYPAVQQALAEAKRRNKK